jgi:hypothetical protein
MSKKNNLRHAEFQVGENIPMLMGDCCFPVLQASFSGARAAQLCGPIRPV